MAAIQLEDRVKLISYTDRDEFNKAANSLIEQGWDIHHSGPSVTYCNGVTRYSALFRVHATPPTQGVEADYEENSATPYDELILEAKADVTASIKSDVKASNADRLTNLLNKRSQWRYLMRENPDIAD